MQRILLALCLLLVAGGGFAQQAYRWVDEKGKVHYSDRPPPPNVKKHEKRNIGGNKIDTSGLPFAVQEALRKYPVTLYTAANCADACDQARAYLKKRGVPYAERQVKTDADMQALLKIAPGREVPTMVVGSEVQKGFAESLWASSLDTAGYPRSAGRAGNAPAPANTAAKPQQ